MNIGNMQFIEGVRVWMECKKCGKKTAIYRTMLNVRAWAVRNDWWVNFFSNECVCKECKNTKDEILNEK